VRAHEKLPLEDYDISDDSELDFLAHCQRSQITGASSGPLGGADTES